MNTRNYSRDFSCPFSGLEKNGSTEYPEDRTNCIQDDIYYGPETARHEYLVPL